MYVTYYLLRHLLMSLLLINQNVCTLFILLHLCFSHSKFVVGMLLFYIYIQIWLTLCINVIRRLVVFLTNLNSTIYSLSCQEVYVVNDTGNPRVFSSIPLPLPGKTRTLSQGTGFQRVWCGYGYGFTTRRVRVRV